jgi:hypothetical protein
MAGHPENVKKLSTRLLGMTKLFTVLEMLDGEVFVETEDIDEDGVVTIEVLRSKDRANFTIVWRERHGSEHNAMRSYPRDSKYPLLSKVKLNA